MKNAAILIGLALCLASTTAKCQPADPPRVGFGTNLVDDAKSVAAVAKSSGILTATNYAVEPYFTYAPRIGPDRKSKVGAGVYALYNMNSYVGAGLGLDYLGKFSLVSGNVSLKYPINAGFALKRYLPWLPASSTNLVVTPFVLGGIGTPTSGANSGVSVITDTGAYFQFGHLWGGRWNVGACYGKWANAGDYSGTRYHAFFGWSKGF